MSSKKRVANSDVNFVVNIPSNPSNIDRFLISADDDSDKAQADDESTQVEITHLDEDDTVDRLRNASMFQAGSQSYSGDQEEEDEEAVEIGHSSGEDLEVLDVGSQGARGPGEEIQCPLCLKVYPAVFIEDHICRCQRNLKYGIVTGAERTQSRAEPNVKVHFHEGKSPIEKIRCPKCPREFYPWSIKKHVAKCKATKESYRTCKYCSKKISVQSMYRHLMSCKETPSRKVGSGSSDAKYNGNSSLDGELRRLARECADVPDDEVVFPEQEDEGDFILLTNPGNRNSGFSTLRPKATDETSGYSQAYISPINHRRMPYPRHLPKELEFFKVSCPTCGIDFNPGSIRKHRERCKGRQPGPVSCKFCFKRVCGVQLKRHLASCSEYISQTRLSYSSAKSASLAKLDAKVIDVPDDFGAEARAGAGEEGAPAQEQACSECGTKFKDRKDLNEHLIVYHKYQWRTKFASREAFHHWFCRKKFDQTMSRIEQVTSDGYTQEAYRCTSSVKGFSRCGCRLTVRYCASEAIARYMDIHSHPVVHHKRRLTQECREMLIRMLQDGMSNEEVIVAARKKVDPFSVDYSLITRKNLNSLRYHHIKRYWHFDEIDLDRLGTAALEAEKEAERTRFEDLSQSGPESEPEPDVDPDADPEVEPLDEQIAELNFLPPRRGRKRRLLEAGAGEKQPAPGHRRRLQAQAPVRADATVDLDDLALSGAGEVVFQPSQGFAIVGGREGVAEDGEEYIEVEVYDDDAVGEGDTILVYQPDAPVAGAAPEPQPDDSGDEPPPPPPTPPKGQFQARRPAGSPRSRTKVTEKQKVRFSEPLVQLVEVNEEESDGDVDVDVDVDVDAGPIVERPWRGGPVVEEKAPEDDAAAAAPDPAAGNDLLSGVLEESSVRRETKNNINNIILPCLQRAMMSPDVTDKQLQILRSQLTDMIVDLQPRRFMGQIAKLPKKKRGRGRGSGKRRM